MTLDRAPFGASLDAALEPAKAFLRIDGPADDEAVAGFVATAAALCEAFTGTQAIVRDVTETVAATGGWVRLSATPVTRPDHIVLRGDAMIERLQRRAAARAEQAAAAGLAAERPEDVAVELRGSALHLLGRRLRERWVTDPAVRAIGAAMRGGSR